MTIQNNSFLHKYTKLKSSQKNFRILYQIWPKTGTKCGSFYTKCSRDSRFFAADEANLSMKWWFAEVARKIENLGGESHAIVQSRKRAGWFLVEQYKSGSRYQIIQWLTLQTNLNPKNKIKAKTEQPQQRTTHNRRSVVRQETPSPRTTPRKDVRTL